MGRGSWLVLLLAACAVGSPGGSFSGGLSGDTGTSASAGSTGTGGSGTGSLDSSTAAAPSTGPDTLDSSSGEPAGPMCGNGALDPGEECDDGNQAACDGCEDCVRYTYLSLDGARGSFGQIGDVPEAPLELLATPLTVEAWVRTEAPGGHVEIMRRGAGNAGWRLGVLPDSVAATVFSGFDHVVPGAAPPGSGWHHVAWTYDQVTSRIYVDGTEVSAMPSTAAVLQTDTPLRLNTQVSSEGDILAYLAGDIDELRVSTVVRYIGPFEPARRHEPDGATALLLHLDEGEGPDLVDASSYAHPGTATGATWPPEEPYGTCG